VNSRSSFFYFHLISREKPLFAARLLRLVYDTKTIFSAFHFSPPRDMRENENGASDGQRQKSYWNSPDEKCPEIFIPLFRGDRGEEAREKSMQRVFIGHMFASTHLVLAFCCVFWLLHC
jgi:hypothetical protein